MIDFILKIASEYEEKCLKLVKTAKIRKLPNGKYRVLSEKGKNLGTMDSKEKAKKRLQQVEFFKHNKDYNTADDDVIDLTKATDLSFSAIMRELRKNATKEQVIEFLKLHKKAFDDGIKQKLKKPEKFALETALSKFNKKHKIKLKEKTVKAYDYFLTYFQGIKKLI